MVQIAWLNGDTWQPFTEHEIDLMMLQNARGVLLMFNRFMPVMVKFGSHILCQKEYLDSVKGKACTFEVMASRVKNDTLFKELFV